MEQTKKIVSVRAYQQEAEVEREELINGHRLFHLKEPMYVAYRKKEYTQLWDTECTDFIWGIVDSDKSLFKALGDALRPEYL